MFQNIQNRQHGNEKIGAYFHVLLYYLKVAVTSKKSDQMIQRLHT